MELDKVVEVKSMADYETTTINRYLNEGWIILNATQYTYMPDGEAYGRVLLGRLGK